MYQLCLFEWNENKDLRICVYIYMLTRGLVHQWIFRKNKLLRKNKGKYNLPFLGKFNDISKYLL